MSSLENMSEWTTKAERRVELVFCADSPGASCSIGKQAGYQDDGSKECYLNNFTLFLIILIYDAVKIQY